MNRKFFIWLSCCLTATALIAQPVQTQIEQSRRFDAGVTPLRSTAAADSPDGAITETAPQSPGDNDLGTQAILKNQFAVQRWLIFGEVAGFYTNNVALTNRSTFDDTFLVGTVGGSFLPKLAENLDADVTVRASSFRYREFDQLNFTSIDAGAGVTYRVPQLANIALFLRYNYNQLISEESGDKFFDNHTITAGVQKIFPLARAHWITVGAAAQWGFADPQEAERDEYAAYAGYHVELTRSLAADLFYRAAYYRYSQAAGRKDFNQNVGAGLRYKVTDWVSVSASASLGLNNSNQSVFDYDVLNTGGGLALEMKF